MIINFAPAGGGRRAAGNCKSKGRFSSYQQKQL